MKTKEASIASRFLASLVMGGMASNNAEEAEATRAEAQMMNEMFRQHEHNRLAQTREGFKVAADLGRKLARAEKTASFMGALKGMLPAARGLQKTLAPGVAKTLGAAEAGALRAAPKTMMMPTALPGGKSSGSSGLRLGNQPTPPPAVPAPAAPVAPTLPTPAPGKPPAAPGTPPATPAAGKSKPLLSFGTKAQLALTAGIGAVGYAGYKGVNAANNYMSAPGHGASTWGQGGPRVKTGVNEYGQPE